MPTNSYMAARWPAASRRLVRAVDAAGDAISRQASRYRQGEITRGEHESLCACGARLCSVLAAVDDHGVVDAQAAMCALREVDEAVFAMLGAPGMLQVIEALNDVEAAVLSASEDHAA